MSIMWILAVLVLVGIYAPVFTEMARIWWTHPYAGHGMFVPVFSALLLWTDRDWLRAVAGQRNPAGMLVILLGFGILALGRWAESLLVQGLSVVIATAGVVLWGFGTRCLRRAAFPVGFLLFMVPLPQVVVDAVTLDLQLFATGFAGAALGFLDIPFYQNGVLIELSTITLNVAEVCNGLRFLMALLVLTLAFAQVSQRTVPRKILLVASAIPIAILANALRVATIAAAVHYIGPQVARGVIHHSIGKGVWALTLIPLIALGLILRRGGGGPDARSGSGVGLWLQRLVRWRAVRHGEIERSQR